MQFNKCSFAEPVGHSHRRSLYCYRTNNWFPAFQLGKIGTVQVAKWRLGDGNSLSVTAKSGTGEIVYIETDWGRNTSYTDFASLRYGKTTLAEIKSKLGGDNFAWDGGRMADGSMR